VRYLWCRRPPDGDVPRFDSDGVRFDITEKDELMIRGVVSNEKARTIVLATVIAPMADGHDTNGDIGKYDIVFAICMKPTKKAGTHTGFELIDRLVG
jgi:hypothetical protein